MRYSERFILVSSELSLGILDDGKGEIKVRLLISKSKNRQGKVNVIQDL